MLPDNFDNEIRKLFDQHAPAPDEKAWAKMETMLNQHLPQGKKERRPLFFMLFLFLILMGGIFSVLFFSPFEHNTKNTSAADNNKFSPSVSVPGNEETSINQNIHTDLTEKIKQEAPENNLQESAVRSNLDEPPAIIQTDQVGQKLGVGKNVARKTVNKKSLIIKPEPVTADAMELKVPLIKSSAEKKITADDPDQEAGKVNTEYPVVITDRKPEDEKLEISVQLKKDSELKTESDETTESEKPVNKSQVKENKNSNPFRNLFFSISAGADKSMIGISGKGLVKSVTGVGLGYMITPRLGIRTGFFTTRKVYEAEPGEYNPPTVFWSYYPNLKHIDADCKVYEIPVIIDYNFNTDKNTGWFVSAGISSLLMKKETYDYYFKPVNSSQYVYYSRSYENKNKHYFSVLNISGGLDKKISRKFTIRAEPYFKIALQGVGYGKVNLNSAGVLVSAVIQPFASEK